LAGSHGGRPSFDTREVWTEWGPDLPTIESRSIPIFGLRPVRTTRFKGGDSPPSCQRPSPGLNASWRDDQIAYFSSERPSPRILRWLSRLRHEEPPDEGRALHDPSAGYIA